MGRTFHIKRGDTSPAMLYVPDAPVDLAGGAQAQFEMRMRGGAHTVASAASMGMTEGKQALVYAWEASDTAVAGQYEAEFRLTYPDGSIVTLPTEGFVTVLVSETVA
jgi:hypothetical protein